MRKIVFFCTLLAIFGLPAFADGLDCDISYNAGPGVVVGETAAELSGCLTSADGGLVASTSDWALGNLQISWVITPEVGGYLYTYNLYGAVKDISHYIFQLSPDCELGTCIWDIDGGTDLADVAFGSYSGTDPANPGMLWAGWGIKLDTQNDPTEFTVSFMSNRIAVWQNFYAKDGKTGGLDVHASNAGVVDESTSFYIAAPDTVIPPPNIEVPEPGTALLLLLGLSGLVLGWRRTA